MVVNRATLFDHLCLGHTVSWWEKVQVRELGRGAEALGFRTGTLNLGRAELHTWLLQPTLLPHAAREVVRSVPLHTMFTELQLCAGPLDSWPDVHAEQGSTPKASSSFTWEWGRRDSLNPSCSPPSPLPRLSSLCTHTHLDPLIPTTHLEFPQKHGYTYLEPP